MLELLQTVELPKVIAVCVSFLVGLVLVLVFISVKLKNLNLRLGDNQVSFNNEERSTIVKIVTDYADFKYKLHEELSQGLNDLKLQARHFASLEIEQYLQRLTTEYLTSIRTQDDTVRLKLTMGVFPLYTQVLRGKFLKFLMDIYEQNHLKDKTQNEIEELAHIHYERLTDLFKEYVQTNWLEEMLPYEMLSEVCQGMSSFVEKLMCSILSYFCGLSSQKFALVNLINRIDTIVREKVQETGKLPINSLTIASSVYIEGSGINTDVVESWLGSL